MNTFRLASVIAMLLLLLLFCCCCCCWFFFVFCCCFVVVVVGFAVTICVLLLVLFTPPFHQVGLLMHETDLLYKDTKQVVRETQTIELSTAGLYQIQRLQLSLNMTQVDEEDPPQYIMEWGGRETGPLSLLGIGKSKHCCTSIFMVVRPWA